MYPYSFEEILWFLLNYGLCRYLQVSVGNRASGLKTKWKFYRIILIPIVRWVERLNFNNNRSYGRFTIFKFINDYSGLIKYIISQISTDNLNDLDDLGDGERWNYFYTVLALAMLLQYRHNCESRNFIFPLIPPIFRHFCQRFVFLCHIRCRTSPILPRWSSRCPKTNGRISTESWPRACSGHCSPCTDAWSACTIRKTTLASTRGRRPSSCESEYNPIDNK